MSGVSECKMLYSECSSADFQQIVELLHLNDVHAEVLKSIMLGKTSGEEKSGKKYRLDGEILINSGRLKN